MYERFRLWFETITEAQIKALAIKEFKNLPNSMSLEEQRNQLREVIDSIYRKTIAYRDARLRLEEKIKRPYFDGTSEA
jgi:hypothetical protein